MCLNIVKNMNLKVESWNDFVLWIYGLVFTFPFYIQLLEHFHFLFLAFFWRLFG